jgi:hypothetical protein
MKLLQIILSSSLLLLTPVAAQTFPPEQIDAFLARISDIDATLKLEREAYDAVHRKDKKWFAEQASIIKRDDLPIFKRIASIQDQVTTDIALRMGACHYAGISIRGVIGAGFENARKGRALSNATRSSAPEAKKVSIADEFAENIQRCERVKRLPRSQRLIGKTIE